MSTQPESPQAVHESNVSATTPLLEAQAGEAKVEAGVGPLVVTASTGGASSPSSPNKAAATAAAPASPGAVAVAAPASPSKQAAASPAPAAAANPQPANEYRFVHLRIPLREGKLRFLLPALLLAFQLVFIVLFAVFGHYQAEAADAKINRYPSKLKRVKL